MSANGTGFGRPKPNGAATEAGGGFSASLGARTVMRGCGPTAARSAATASMAATPPPATTMCGWLLMSGPYERGRATPSVVLPRTAVVAPGRTPQPDPALFGHGHDRDACSAVGGGGRAAGRLVARRQLPVRR